MKERTAMKSIRKIIVLYEQKLLSRRGIGAAVNLPHTTVADYINRYGDSSLDLEEVKSLTDREIYDKLFIAPRSRDHSSDSILPDFSYIHTELHRPHVTRQLLWEEYRERYPDGLGYSQFCQRYNDYKKTLSISMRQVHRAGEKLFIDYSGSKVPYTDRVTGEVHSAEIFIAVLGASGYSYAEASANQRKESFVSSHINTFKYMEGITAVLVPDNLKSAVTQACFYDPGINRIYQDMAEHYNCVVIPARVRKPKDKSKVELSVSLVQRWILARLRNHHFSSIAQINEAIWPLLERLNDKKIRHLGKSRYELYKSLDKPALQGLPATDYILREIRICRVNIDYHIQLEGAFYSVPYQLVHKEVRAFYTSRTVEIFHETKQVAQHMRQHKKGYVSTHKEHMASSHRVWADMSPSRLVRWGAEYGASMQQLIESILKAKPHPELGFRTCLGILAHAKSVKDDQVLELTAQKMLTLKSYRVKHFKEIIKSKSYLLQKTEEEIPLPDQHENLRPSTYYN
ncbi:IS21 family transposase [bacterium]|nr:IS21 family transposase [bacterium]